MDEVQHIFKKKVNKLNHLVQLLQHLSAENFNNDYFKMMHFPMLSLLLFAIKLPIRLTLQHKHLTSLNATNSVSVNPFVPNTPFPYLLKTSQNRVR